jgi:hypothetical protein
VRATDDFDEPAPGRALFPPKQAHISTLPSFGDCALAAE